MTEIIAAIVAGLFSVSVAWITHRVGQIHKLVNSNFTVVLKTQRDLMYEVIALKRELNIEPSEESIVTLKELEDQIRSRE